MTLVQPLPREKQTNKKTLHVWLVFTSFFFFKQDSLVVNSINVCLSACLTLHHSRKLSRPLEEFSIFFALVLVACLYFHPCSSRTARKREIKLCDSQLALNSPTGA